MHLSTNRILSTLGDHTQGSFKECEHQHEESGLCFNCLTLAPVHVGGINDLSQPFKNYLASVWKSSNWKSQLLIIFWSKVELFSYLQRQDALYYTFLMK